MAVATALPAERDAGRILTDGLLRLTDTVAATLLAVDLLVVIGSVSARSLFNAPVEWSDDVARGLMVGSSFFGAASALGRGENVGVSFFVDRVRAPWRGRLDACVALLATIIAGFVAFHAAELGISTTGQTTGSGLPLEWTFFPMAGGAACMTVFALDHALRRDRGDLAFAAVAIVAIAGFWWAWSTLAPDSTPSPGIMMTIGFVLSLGSGMAIGFALALSALVFIWVEGTLPGVIFAQQMARGIDNFVLLAIPFFILVGYLMEANGMSVRLIELLERLVGRVRGGLNVVMVLSMVVFSGISGSKMADVAAVGSVLIPAARRQKQDPGKAVALLAASAVMAEAIPPCINLIILGYVANISIGGLFAAGIFPAILMALALILGVVVLSRKAPPAPVERSGHSNLYLIGSGAISLGVIAIIFGGYRSGFATATEIGAFAVVYALVVGAIAFRELTVGAVLRLFVASATLSGMILFVVAASQTVAFSLTIQQVPHALADAMIALSHGGGAWLFMIASILILIVMGAALEGAPALIIFGPLLLPVATSFGFAPLHYGIVLIIAMGLGLFAPPLGLGLYTSCAVGNVPIEGTVRPIAKYLLMLFVCLLLIAFVPEITLWLPRAMGFIR